MRVKAIQEQQVQIDELRKQVAGVDALKQEIAELRALVNAQARKSPGED